MIMRPKVLLLDEPTEGIQPNIIQQIGRVIDYLKGRGDMAIVLVEQYFDFAYGLADQFYVFRRGAVSKSGSKAELPREVADEARPLVGGERGAPAFHLRDLAFPAGLRQALRHDEIRLVTADALRLGHLDAGARRQHRPLRQQQRRGAQHEGECGHRGQAAGRHAFTSMRIVSGAFHR